MRFIDKTNSRTFGRRAFTLAELLIVVAIIAVLVGISIPIFNAQLEKSREATDIANMRAAKAAAIDIYYAGINEDNCSQYGLYSYNSDDFWGVYDPDSGTFYSLTGNKGQKFSNLVSKLGLTKDDAYGQGTATDGGTISNGYKSNFNYDDAVIVVSVYPNITKSQGDLIKKFNDGEYKSYLDGCTLTNGKYGFGCVIIEWRRLVPQNGSYVFVGRDVSNNNKPYGQVIFID